MPMTMVDGAVVDVENPRVSADAVTDFLRRWRSLARTSAPPPPRVDMR